MSKNKGSRAERELIHKFFDTNEFIALRAAGSGSTPLPSPDILAGGMGRILAIECKSGKDKRYIKKNQIDELKIFSERFGAEPWIGLRFDNEDWWFLSLENLVKSRGENFMVSLDIARKKGLRFEELIGKFKQKKII